MSSSIKTAEKGLEDLAIERFKLLLQIQKEIRLGEFYDENISIAKAQMKNDEDRLRDSEVYFVSGFNDDTTEEDLRLYFNKYGQVKEVKMKKKTIKFALVYFGYDSIEDQKKFEKKIHVINGKRIYLNTNQEVGENAVLVSGFEVKYVSVVIQIWYPILMNFLF